MHVDFSGLSMQVFSYSKTSKIFNLILFGSLELFIGTLFVGRLLRGVSKHDGADKYFVALYVLLILLMIAYLILETIRAKFIIGEKNISYTAALFTHQLGFDEIRGYRVYQRYLDIEPLSPRKKRIRVNTLLSGRDQIIEWLKNGYPDLDLLEKKATYRSLLLNESYGKTIDDRKRRFNYAIESSKVINVAGVVICLLCLPSKINYYILPLAIAAPMIFIIIMRAFKGLIRIGIGKNDPCPSILWGFLALILILSGKAFFYHINDYHDVWQKALFFAIIPAALLIFRSREFIRAGGKSRAFGIIIVVFLSFVYGFASILILNCRYDTSDGKAYQAVVLFKVTRSKKSDSYRIALSAREKRSVPYLVNLSREMYDKLQVSDQVSVNHYEGLLKIPWSTITDHQKDIR